MLNSIGLQNPGIDAFLADSLPRLAALGVPLWVSVGGSRAADYALVCEPPRRAATTSQSIELNLSCPNVEEAPETAAELVAAARAATRKPLYAKLSPATWDIAESARAVADAGADGLSLVNTIRGLALDADHAPSRARARCRAATRARRSGRSRSRASTRARAPSTCRSSAWAACASGADALDLVAAGASAVALGTVLFADPWAARRIRSELESPSAGRARRTRSAARDSRPAAVP